MSLMQHILCIIITDKASQIMRQYTITYLRIQKCHAAIKSTKKIPFNEYP